MENVLAVILAGGQGERLNVLAQERAKPAIPFVGKYRIIDFTISNCANSGISNVAVLTQYQPLSLADHIGIGAPWGLVPPDRGIRLIQPYLTREEGRDWYKGTADAVYQNLAYIEEQGAELVLILSGDHIYKMDYSPLIALHEENQADVTLAITQLPETELQRFGTVLVDEEGRVTGFQEKVKKPKSNLVSMGVYLFRKDILNQWLEENARNNKHDFGRHIFPKMVTKGKIFTYLFDGYWRDVGTVQSYWQTSMEVLEMCPSFLQDPDWPIRTKEEERPPAMISGTARVINTLLPSGCVIDGRVENSILFPGVRVAEDAIVKDSIIMNDSVIGRDSTIDRSILDKEVIVEADCHVGFGYDFQVNRIDPEVLNTGLTIVGKRTKIPSGTKIGRNCIIYSNVLEDDFRSSSISSGETVKPRRRRARSKA